MRKKKPEDLRSFGVSLNFTTKEVALIDRLAKHQGLDRATFLRMCVLKIIRELKKEVKEGS